MERALPGRRSTCSRCRPVWRVEFHLDRYGLSGFMRVILNRRDADTQSALRTFRKTDQRAAGILPGRDAWPHASAFLMQRRKSAELGRARSPLRAGVGCAAPASRAGILASAPLRARLRLTAEALRRRVKVGRVPHVRDALQSICPKPFGGQRTARPTKIGL